MNGKPTGPWRVCADMEVREYGWGEDSMLYTDVVFLVATNEQGFRYAGPTIGNSRNSRGGLEALKAQADEAVAALEADPTFDPTTNHEWGQWFPVYGSVAYELTNQEAAYLDAEKTDRPYYPAGW